MRAPNQHPKQALRRAAQVLGGQAALAAALGFKSRKNVWPWFSTERPFPAEHCPAIERLTRGEVRCEELRPDIDWAVLRGQPHPEGRPCVDVAGPAQQREAA